MIRHIVFFTVAEGQDVEDVRAKLMMLADIPHARHFEVTRNIRHDSIAGMQVDLVVYGEFDDIAALEAFKEHPIYDGCIAKVRPLREMRIAADVEAAPTSG